MSCKNLQTTGNLGRARRSRTTMQQSPHWLQWDAQNSPTKLPLPLRRLLPPSNTPIPRPTHSPSQTASGSSQPFFHSTLDTHRQSDRPTDGISNRYTPLALTLAMLIESDALIIRMKCKHYYVQVADYWKRQAVNIYWMQLSQRSYLSLRRTLEQSKHSMTTN